jgi:hypothetical protein
MAASACVSTSCSSISGARESYGRVQKLERSGFCGKRVTVGSLAAGAQQWLLPSTTARAVSKSSSSKRSLIITSVLAEISSQTMVSAQSHNNTHTHTRTHTHTQEPHSYSLSILFNGRVGAAFKFFTLWQSY